MIWFLKYDTEWLETYVDYALLNIIILIFKPTKIPERDRDRERGREGEREV